mmetsp:Transcript_1561/g.3397  ORF Transcript_1561/g.3397 Transcript_1561/m.3397 type:complete len:109 (-) Transcript_1561:38-364(-)
MVFQSSWMAPCTSSTTRAVRTSSSSVYMCAYTTRIYHSSLSFSLKIDSGVYTFADIRKSGLGFDALWKPGDALIERYTDGNYRGVYFQVELADEEFRQYLVPLDLFQM